MMVEQLASNSWLTQFPMDSKSPTGKIVQQTQFEIYYSVLSALNEDYSDGKDDDFGSAHFLPRETSPTVAAGVRHIGPTVAYWFFLSDHRYIIICKFLRTCVDRITASVFDLFYLSLTNTIRNKNQKNFDCETSWLVYTCPET